MVLERETLPTLDGAPPRSALPPPARRFTGRAQSFITSHSSSSIRRELPAEFDITEIGQFAINANMGVNEAPRTEFDAVKAADGREVHQSTATLFGASSRCSN